MQPAFMHAKAIKMKPKLIKEDDEFPIPPYRIDMLKASLPEPSQMVFSYIAGYSPSEQYVLSNPPPLLLCQMTNAHLMTNTPYQGSEPANVSNFNREAN